MSVPFMHPDKDKRRAESTTVNFSVLAIMLRAERRLQAILLKYKSCGFNAIDYQQLDVNRKMRRCPYLGLTGTAIVVSVVCLVFWVCADGFGDDSSECLVDMPADASKWFRAPESCGMCTDLTQIPKVSNISADELDAQFVHHARPVVVSDGAASWPALHAFSFDFFKTLYAQNDVERDACQFFPYKTEFASLAEALQMDPKRAQLQAGTESWYIGWSNCNDNVGKILRGYYQSPYFLPKTSEEFALNWIFMGGPGPGAHMHVDNVHYPSWQAQLKGRKLWRLAPPPECYYRCQEVQVVVEPGEIIVVDTNRWYHQTIILSGEVSITIGSEFD